MEAQRRLLCFRFVWPTDDHRRIYTGHRIFIYLKPALLGQLSYPFALQMILQVLLQRDGHAGCPSVMHLILT